jgi:hypothetical protein
MFSIVIPTLYRSESIYRTILELSREDSVGEVILVDNTGNDRPFRVDKLVHLLEGRNTFVNPAWNKGVSIARHDKVCLLNDDIFFDWSVLSMLLPMITADVGFIGMHPENMSNDRPGPFYGGGLELVRPLPDGKTRAGHRPTNWGTCIMFDRSIWDPIPDDMLVWGGDDWLFYRSTRQNFMARGFNCRGQQSASVDSMGIQEVTTRDMMNMAGHVRRGELDNYLVGTIWWQ